MHITRNAELLEIGADSFSIEQVRDIIKMRPSNQIMIIGKQIRSFRKSRGFTLVETATRCGLHPNSLWNLERGLVIPTMFNLHRIYYSMGVKKLTACYDCLQLIG
ncbi:MAG: helix-turn-helix transcriptional regulator [Breznakiellaceae bacterium]